MATHESLERQTYDVPTLVAEHPPVIHDPNKRAVWEEACPDKCAYAGELGYSRWPALPLSARVDASAHLDRVVDVPTVYDYEPVADLPGAVEWHVNFADPFLFFAYGTGLFAQDEMMCAEHPVLGSLVEALRESGHAPVTEDGTGPTPVLVTGVQRRCHIVTNPDPAEGRPRGLYGNEFSAADEEVVRRATVALDPPTITNIIAMAAPSYRSGRYTRDTIERVLVTAYTGFVAAVAESARLAPGAPVVVHSGFWGCGAFGGDRVLMSVLQVLAAGMAEVDRLVFHTCSIEGAAPFEHALGVVRDEIAPAGELGADELVDRIDAMAFEWGTSDGN
ncbi:MAG: hypothetical protein Q7W44_10495 [Coriobacteriia bacterium]|nr:hypothetical protein [Coriobacteriia bacterium]